MQLLPLLLSLGSASTLVAGNWPAWRGPNGDGLCTEKNLPTKWSATENIAWKIELPGPGQSTPVVWSDRIFLTQARPSDGARGLMCLNAKDGSLRWDRWIPWTLKEPSHEANPPCSSSAVTDGSRVVALLGSAGLFCCDMDGKELWKRSLGPLEHEWGYGASPVIEGNRVIVNFGPGAGAFLGAFDLATGAPVWKVAIPEERPLKRTDGFSGNESKGVVGSWTTPVLMTAAGRREVVFPFNSRLRGFDPADGRQLWSCEGLTPLFYASPIPSGDTVFLVSGYRGNALAVKAGGSGDVTEKSRLWHEVGAKSGIGTGVASEGKVYYHTGSLGLCRDVVTGKILWEERLRGTSGNVDSWSSITLADGLLYIPNQAGDVIVVRASPAFEIVAVNSIGGEKCNASLAAADGRLYLRTHERLWAIGK